MEMGVPGSLMGLPTGISISFSQFSSRSSGQFQQSGRAASSKIRLMGLDLRPKCLWNINRGQCSILSWHGFWYYPSLWEFTLILCVWSIHRTLHFPKPHPFGSRILISVLSCFIKALASRAGDESQEGLRMYFQETFRAGTHSVSVVSSCLFWEVFSLWIVLKRKLHAWHLLPGVSGAVLVLTPPFC